MFGHGSWAARWAEGACCCVRSPGDASLLPIKAHTVSFDAIAEEDVEFYSPRSSTASSPSSSPRGCFRETSAAKESCTCSAAIRLRRPVLLRQLTGELNPRKPLLQLVPRPAWLGRLGKALRRGPSTLHRSISGLFQPKKPDFAGVWTCVDTWGLPDFLRACGASEWQVLCAAHAPWPQWEFKQQGDHFVYINRNSLCDLREEFKVGGPEYVTFDTRRKELRCEAHWFEHTTLVIDRHGEDGHFRERRHIGRDGKLVFTLEALKPGMEGCSWGRTFERKRN